MILSRTSAPEKYTVFLHMLQATTNITIQISSQQNENGAKYFEQVTTNTADKSENQRIEAGCCALLEESSGVLDYLV